MKFVSKKKMKKPLLALILIINISGITCDALETLSCKNVNDICYYDEDCCSQYCFKSFEWFNGACKPLSPDFDSDSNPTDKIGICEFHMQTDESEIDYLNNEFDRVNAAHNSLPPYTLIKVSYKGRTTVITVNDHIPRTNGSLLDLSNDAALMLQIKNEQSVLCIIEKVIHHNSILKMILYALPILSFIIILSIFI
ncbi:uncharacterized protein LOC100570300 [Acyrthosiphon pisum]|uniref:RlpA-like protein double-psi beta-barrel domain-containing protein n=1 Tax=Acyrthosiphon pisum TaxID=7029 RepID=A0A8R2AB62_ACYPI|nr:uncharacterized protein LOC100570300 [Acyrthosiphon pisum]|eukprot:XP_003244385.1 PREDICTED: uncharacterized protein LOC100570300 [Acyrthosiphon pisum]